jgi:hypothetical protein
MKPWAQQKLPKWQMSHSAPCEIYVSTTDAYAAGDKTSSLVVEYFEAVKSVKNESVLAVLTALQVNLG